MRFLVDSNVLSEPTKPEPDAGVLDWLRENEPEFAIDSIVLGEVLAGILKLPPGRRRDRLETWFEQGVSQLVCLSWTPVIGERWAHLVTDLRKAGFNTPVTDTMIAATALVHGLTLVTRNVKDFRGTGVKLLNPFDG